MNNNLGPASEMNTVFYLEDLGCIVLCTNWRRNWGELDIVAYEKTSDTVIFVEVKARRTSGPAADLELIGKMKRKRLERAARSFLADGQTWRSGNTGLSDKSNLRFDLVVWRGEEMRHYPDVI